MKKLARHQLGKFGVGSVSHIASSCAVGQSTIRRMVRSGRVRTVNKKPLLIDFGDVMLCCPLLLIPKLSARVIHLQQAVDSFHEQKHWRHACMDAARRGDWLRIAIRTLCAWERVGQEPSRHVLANEIARYSRIGDTSLLSVWIVEFLEKGIDLH